MIGDRLFMSTAMVKRRVRHIFDKLEVHSRSQALAEASKGRLIWRPPLCEDRVSGDIPYADLMARI
jgi:hypothetical protein